MATKVSTLPALPAVKAAGLVYVDQDVTDYKATIYQLIGISGSVTIPNGADSVAVAGLALPIAPSQVLVGFIKPSADNYNLFGTVRADSITTDGFTVDLSGSVDLGTYRMVYWVKQ